MDKIKLAMLIGYISCITRQTVTSDEIQEIEKLCVPEFVKASQSDVDYLMKSMHDKTDKISAIKSYRALTGASLLEAKNAVEAYW